jgi:hypothetical protein
MTDRITHDEFGGLQRDLAATGAAMERRSWLRMAATEVYPALTSASQVSNKIATSQIALPKATCDEVYATSGCETSVVNLSQISLATDNVFSEGAALELATMSGTVAGGLTATLTVAIAS